MSDDVATVEIKFTAGGRTTIHTMQTTVEKMSEVKTSLGELFKRLVAPTLPTMKTKQKRKHRLETDAEFVKRLARRKDLWKMLCKRW